MVASCELICGFGQSKLAAGVDLDQVVLDSWNPYPAHTFPASDPTALINLSPINTQHDPIHIGLEGPR